jgi:hypothetical protein
MWLRRGVHARRRHADEFARSAAAQSEHPEEGGWVHHDLSALTDRELDQLQVLLANVNTWRVETG